MATECGDLSAITNEDLLRKMWQEADDYGRKKEIRAHMYKLREQRLREFYINEMDSNNSFNSKAPITSAHGDAMADHSFESMKSKEIRDSESPTRDRYGMISPNTGGWNVISSTETSDDGKCRTEQMLATTEGVKAIKGGHKEFAGKNEEMRTEKFDGDDKNFTYATGESSSTALKENIVTGDDNNKRIENKTSSSSHSTKIIRSSHVDGGDNDSVMSNSDQQNSKFSSTSKTSSSSSSTIKTSSDTKTSQHQENISMNNDNLNEMKSSQDPNKVKEAFRLASMPGNVISRQTEMANPTTKLITETKELQDGTIVTTKRYEKIDSSSNVDIRPVQQNSKETKSSTTTSSTSSTTKSSNQNQNDRHDNTTKITHINTTDMDDKSKEAFRLAAQPGSVISRQVEMANPTTQMIIEKKQLHDGTIVTTKRYEQIGTSSTDNVEIQPVQQSRVSDTKTSTTSTINRTKDDVNKKQDLATTTTTTRVHQVEMDDKSKEAFKQADKAGIVISRHVEKYSPTTQMIVEKKQLQDGTIVSTKRYETIGSSNTENVKQSRFSDTQTNSTINRTNKDDVSRNQDSVTTTTTTRVHQVEMDDKSKEAFKLAEKPGTIISRHVEKYDPTTQMITEKKQLHDGTIITTKRYETIGSSNNENVQQSKFSDTQTTSTINRTNKSDVDRNQDSKTTTTTRVHQVEMDDRSKEAFKLAEKPGTVISREVERTNPTTQMITEKKQLEDGTIVTTKRYETIGSSNTENVQQTKISDTKTSTINRTDKNDVNRNLDSTTKTTTTRVHQVEMDDKSKEAFRLAEKPGTIISREVEMASPTTQKITEKKQLEDGTVVTTKRYEQIGSTKTTQNQSENVVVKKSSQLENDDKIDRRQEVVEEAVTRRFIDTNCPCPSAKHQHNENFIKKERNIPIDNQSTKPVRNDRDFADIEKSIIADVENKKRDDVIKKQTTTQEFVNRKITVEVDKAHDAFARSLRCVTPPNERNSTPNLSDRGVRSPSQDTTKSDTSRISSSTSTTRKSTTEVKKNEDFMKPTLSSDRRSSKQPQSPKGSVIDDSPDHPDSRSSSPQKTPVKKSPEDTDRRSSSPQKHPQTTKKITETVMITETDRRSSSPQKKPVVENGKAPSPQKSPHSNKKVTETVITTETIDTRADRRSSTPKKKPQTKPDDVDNDRRSSSPQKTPQPSKKSQKVIETITTEVVENGQQKIVVDTEDIDSTQKKITEIIEVTDRKSKTPQRDNKTPTGTLEKKPRGSTVDKIEQFITNEKIDQTKVNSRSTSPQKVPQNTPSQISRETSPNKPFMDTLRKPTTDKIKIVTTTDESEENLFTTTIDLINEDRTIDELKITQKIDSKPISPTTSVSDLEYFHNPEDNRMITDLDSEDNIEININIENLKNYDDLKIITNVSEVTEKEVIDRMNSIQKTMKDEILDIVDKKKTSVPAKRPSVQETTTIRKESQTIKRKESDTVKRKDSQTTTTKRDSTTPSKKEPRRESASPSKNEPRRDSASPSKKEPRRDSTSPSKKEPRRDSTSPTKKEPRRDSTSPTKRDPTTPGRKDSTNKKQKPPLNRSETYEERCMKILGMKTKDQPDNVVTKPSSTTPVKKDNRISEIRERKAKIEKEQAELEKITKKKSSITKTTTDFISSEVREEVKNKKGYSPERSPERCFRHPTKKPSDATELKTNERVSINNLVNGVTNTIVTDTKPRPQSPDKKFKTDLTKHTESSILKVTNVTHDIKELRSGSPDRKKEPMKRTEINIPVNKGLPEKKHIITVAKIKISPAKTSTIRSVKTTEVTKPMKVAPSIKLVKKPINDLSSTEPDSEQEYDRELIKNVDKTSKITRKKIIQSRKDSAPVQRTTVDKDSHKFSRSISENTFKPDTNTIKKRPSARDSGSDVKSSREKLSQTPKKDVKRPTKCVTTKTINLTPTTTTLRQNIKVTETANVVIDVQQAKSSREHTPNKVVPIPVKDDENVTELRHPDTVIEPDDNSKFKTKVRNIPIFEESTNQYIGIEITEMDDDIKNTDNYILEENENEEYYDKDMDVISSETLQRANIKRNSIQIDPIDDDDEDNCLMSVQQKVNKFISTAEEVKKPKSSTPFKPEETVITPEPEDESPLKVNAKVSKLSQKFQNTTDETSILKTKETTEKRSSVTREFRDENLREDECLMSVQDKVHKFINSAEKLVSSVPEKSPTLVKNIMRQSNTSSTTDEVQERDILGDYRENTLKTEERSDSRSTLRSGTGSEITLKSTEAVKKARAIFEGNDSETTSYTSDRISKHQDRTSYTSDRTSKHQDRPSYTPDRIAKQQDILSRPSIWEARKNPALLERKPVKSTSEINDMMTKTRVTTTKRDNKESSPEPRVKSSVTTRRGSSDFTTRTTVTTTNRDSSEIISEPRTKTTVTRRESSEISNEPRTRSTVTTRRESSEITNEPRTRSALTTRRESSEITREPRTKTTVTTTTRREPSEITSESRTKTTVTNRRESSEITREPKTITTVTTTRRDSREISGEPLSPTMRKLSGERTPAYMRDQVSTKKDLFEKRISSSRLESTELINRKTISPQTSREDDKENDILYSPTRKTSSPGDKPSYMSHTVASLEHVNASRRDSDVRRDSLGKIIISKNTRNMSESTTDSHDIKSPRTPTTPTTPTKFGVELRRTDSGRFGTTSHSQVTTRKSSTTTTTSNPSELQNVEEIFDLEALEKLLEIVVGYEQRRRIRAQIRVVKKLVSEGKFPTDSKNSRKSFVTLTERVTNTKSKAPSQTVTTTRTYQSKPSMKLLSDSDAGQARSIQTTTTTTRYVVDKQAPQIEDSSVKTQTRTITQKYSTATKEDKSPRSIIESFNRNSPKTKNETVKTTINRKVTSSNQKKEVREMPKDINSVTSPYGIGPTDENGMPLFGLKALRKKTTPSTTETKVIGTVISETSYSENGQPAIVQRKSMHYSTDPSDLADVDANSRTSTVERKNSRGGVYSVTKIEKFQKNSNKPQAITSTPTSAKVIRRGSVKELKEKFIKRDSSSSVTEKVTKTKTTRSSMDLSDDENESCHIHSSADNRSFLNSDKKATNVQEVITYMRNADNVKEDGDSKDDIEARALLNKFLGATALMTSIESGSGLSKSTLESGGTNRNVSSTTFSNAKVTKATKSSSAKDNKNYDIDELWDINFLRKLLESSTNYEERRKIRGRIRIVMADKEVCADLVKSVQAELEGSTENSSNTTDNSTINIDEGESLLLPLIQGILQNRINLPRQLVNINNNNNNSKNNYNNQIGSTSSNNKHNIYQNANYVNTNDPNIMNSENYIHNNRFNNHDNNQYLPIVEDSGTESGEDLRLLAAGLQNNLNKMEQQSALNNNLNVSKAKSSDALGSGLLAEVTTALERLQNSLKEGEISIDEKKKEALLNLVYRLQRGLISPEKIVESNSDKDSAISTMATSPNENEEKEIEQHGRRGGSMNRFSKKRNRVNRHTVGVTREELADARRIIEELELLHNLPGTVTKITAAPIVASNKSLPYNAILTRQISEPVTLLRPSEFMNHPSQSQGKYRVLLKQSVSLDPPPSILKHISKFESKPLAIEPLPQPKKFNNSQLQRTFSNSNREKFVVNKINNNKINTTATNDHEEDSDESSSSSSDEEEDSSLKFYNNKLKRNQQPTVVVASPNLNNFNYSSGDENTTHNRTSKYTSKKMKMKRANTIDIPKSYSFVNTFNLSDKEFSDGETLMNTSRNRNLNNVGTGLKTTITGGVQNQNSNRGIAPKFTPKTDNDHKFLAFIQKQSNSPVPAWVNPKRIDENTQKTPNWSNKFGSLKNLFEHDGQKEEVKPPQKAVTNAAANFWKKIENEVPVTKHHPIISKIPVQSTKPLSKLPISTERFPWIDKKDPTPTPKPMEDIPKKKIVIDKFVPKEQIPVELPKVVHEPNKLMPKPMIVNQFSHAPMSAFKPPVSKKIQATTFKPIQPIEDVKISVVPKNVSGGLVKQMAENTYNAHIPPPIQPRKIINSPTKTIGHSTFSKLKNSIENHEPTIEPTVPAPWAGRAKTDRVMNIATSKFENTPQVHLNAQLPPAPEPLPPLPKFDSVKYRNNPLYNGTFEKRSSLPPNAVYSNFDSASSMQPFENAKFNSLSKRSSGSTGSTSPKQSSYGSAKSYHSHSSLPASTQSSQEEHPPYTFVITDFTQPSSVSTYVPNESYEPPHPAPLVRQDSLTNPAQEPLVLTATRNVISPRDTKPKLLELYPNPIPMSPSNDVSVSNDVSFSDELDFPEMPKDDGTEYKAVVAKVMKSPITQTAVSEMSGVTSLNDQLKEDMVIKSLQNSLLKFNQKSPTPDKRAIDNHRLSQDSSSSSLDFKLPHMKIPSPTRSKEQSGFNQGISAYPSPPRIAVRSPMDMPPNVLYNNIGAANNVTYNNVSGTSPTSHINALQRAKSSHSLAVPPPSSFYRTSPVEIEKQKTVAAYFSGKKSPIDQQSQPNPRPLSFVGSQPQKSNVNLTRKSSIQAKIDRKNAMSMGGLSRSKTMPHISGNLELLDETNVDDAFEELLSGSNL